jgi:hypothetical protein
LTEEPRFPRRQLLLRRMVLAALSILLGAQLLGGALTIAWQSDTDRAYSGILGLAGTVLDLRVARDDGGYHVLRVDPDSPASDAGLQVGDVITSVDGVSLADSPESFFRSVTAGRAGTPVSLVWSRGGAPRAGRLVLGHRSPSSGASDASRVDLDLKVGVGSSPWGRYGLYLLPPLLMLIVGVILPQVYRDFIQSHLLLTEEIRSLKEQITEKSSP